MTERTATTITAEEAAALAQKGANGDRYTLPDLLAVMAALRTPGIGCAWDLEQTYATIASYTIEEAYEVADAIQREDFVDLEDELGDLLLQPIFHAQMAAEEGRFTFDDVVDGIARKMIRRHPHVFGDAEVREASRVLDMWDRIKAGEAAAKREAKGLPEPQPGEESVLDGVPHALPALTRSVKLQNRAAKIGFDWLVITPVLEKLKEEIAEFEAEIAAGDTAHAAEEYGDMLFVMANLGRRLKIDPEEALRATSAKFERRFRHIERRLHEQGRKSGEATLEDMDVLWNEAKALERDETCLHEMGYETVFRKKIGEETNV
jgi:ATP diphosphatase